ncbi:homoserine kinase [Selenomonadales bacterium OttesenSCG-928-I06]|nr:homoserine kinase [Selenomonadales bacterium OttesenSCG-928-I06]
MTKTIKVRVPGTTANCGAGFDTLGIALTIYNEVELTLSEDNTFKVTVEGVGANILPTNEGNIVVRTIRYLLNNLRNIYPNHYKENIAKLTGLNLKLVNNIPLSHGLGSSAAAIVGGLWAANEATGAKFSKDDILQMATELEGHPDNVAPAIFGGVTVSIVDQGIDSSTKATSLKVNCNSKISLIAVIPEFELSTKTARKALPAEVPLKDAIFNIGRATMFIGALCEGKTGFLKYALDDKLHQPYREKFIIGMKDVFHAAIEKGALGSVISGSGPTLIAFAENDFDAIGQGMVEAFRKHKVNAKYVILNIDNEGVIKNT